ncbi:FIG003620: Proteophosphoglycan precursor (Fragment) [hydrothermal vent metagenome]|uniref:FIG003620: Proteophosphoglycan n=1 Tax=hydrothermal vent metagenome TaxID=652676 RepID=A0A3B0R560_9ZZZZ
MPYTPPPELASLSLTEIAELAAAQKLPPVDQWAPENTGDSEMRIAADGIWYHQGSIIARPAMVRAFSTILRKEKNGGYVLVTPFQKLAIEVEDAPFLAVEMEAEGSGKTRKLAFRLNTDHLVVADADHSLRFPGDRPQPYLHVRGGLEAKLSRPVYYELAEMALNEMNEAENDEPFGLWSNGAFFPIEKPE